MRTLLLTLALLAGGCRCLAEFPSYDSKVPDRPRLDAPADTGQDRAFDVLPLADGPKVDGPLRDRATDRPRDRNLVDSRPPDLARDRSLVPACTPGICTAAGGSCKGDNFCEIDCNGSATADCSCGGALFCRMHCHGGGCTKSASCGNATVCQIRCNENSVCDNVTCSGNCSVNCKAGSCKNVSCPPTGTTCCLVDCPDCSAQCLPNCNSLGGCQDCSYCSCTGTCPALFN